MPRLVITRTPLRVSFVGGGSDIPRKEVGCSLGRTVSSSIDKYIYSIVKWRHDDDVVVHWREREVAKNSRDIKHDLIREILVSRGINHGIEVATFADVPGVGSGLGSSAATTVGVMHAVLVLQGLQSPIDTRGLAELSCAIEIERLGVRCGRQDQYASAIGGLLDMSHDQGVVTEVKSLPRGGQAFELQSLLHLFSPRDSFGRNAGDQLEMFVDTDDFRDSCINLCVQFIYAFGCSNLDELCSAIGEHHALKMNHFSYMDPKLESDLTSLAYDFTLKLCGAGLTGHLLVACLPEVAENVCPYIEECWGPELPFKFEDSGSTVIHSE